MSEAVVVIDMVQDFVSGKLKCDRASAIIPNIARLLSAAREKAKPVVYVSDAHLPTDWELKLWGEHSMKGTPGAQIISELQPSPTDFILEKRTYSAFHETGLDSLLRSLKVDTVVITGLHTNICDRHTAADAFFRGYSIVIPEDCVEAFTAEEQKEGLEYLKKNYDVKTLKSTNLIQKWQHEG
ncbi:MAG: cysteine hydrolase family protein [Candidatus Bathyarchaeia archaeon]